MAPSLPQEIVDQIVDEVALDEYSAIRDQIRDLKAFSLIASKWLHRSRTYLFRTIELTSDNFPAWCKTVRSGVGGPSRHVTYIRYKPSWVEAERKIGPLEGLARSPSHMAAFTNLRILHFVDISLQHANYLPCFGGLAPVVRELWLEDCQMDINQFVSFIRPFTNIARLRLMRPQCTGENKLDSALADLLPLKGTLEFHQPGKAASKNIASFIHELSLIRSYITTMVFRERLDAPKAANELLAASRETLTKLTFGHISIPKGISLRRLKDLKKLELSTLAVGVLPSVLRTVASYQIESIRFILLVHQLEDFIDDRTRRSWSELDLELYALASRSFAAQRYGRGLLQVTFVDVDPTTPVSVVEETARLFLPMSQQHRYISFSVG